MKKTEAQEAKQSKAQELSYRAASLLRWGRLRTEVAARCEHVFHALEPPGRNIVKSARPTS